MRLYLRLRRITTLHLWDESNAKDGHSNVFGDAFYPKYFGNCRRVRNDNSVIPNSVVKTLKNILDFPDEFSLIFISESKCDTGR